MKTTGTMQTQIDCALIHLRAAQQLVQAVPQDDPRIPVAIREVQIGIDRLEDRWGT